VDFHIASPLEFFIDHIIHAAAGINQRGGKNGQAAAFFNVAGRAKESLRFLQGVGIDPAGQYLAGGRLHRVVGTRQPRNRVKQNDHIFFMLNQALGLGDDHFSHLHVACRRLVERGSHHFALHRAGHFGDFFRALINQQHNQHGFGMIGGNRMGNMLQHHRFAGLRRRNDQTTRTFADGRNDVDDAAGHVFFRLDFTFQLEGLVRKQWRQVFKQNFVFQILDRATVRLVELGQRKVAFTVFRGANLAFDGVASVQIEAANLRWRHINIIGIRQIRRVRRAQKTKAIGQDFQHAVPENTFTGFGRFFE